MKPSAYSPQKLIKSAHGLTEKLMDFIMINTRQSPETSQPDLLHSPVLAFDFSFSFS
jgi:hypothetical protein